MDFFVMGGFPMVVVVVFGLMGVASAARFAWAPGPARLPYLVALGAAVLFAGLGGSAVDLLAVSQHITGTPELAESPELLLYILTGLGEAMAPTILAAGILIAQALLTALGLRRAIA